MRSVKADDGQEGINFECRTGYYPAFAEATAGQGARVLPITSFRGDPSMVTVCLASLAFSCLAVVPWAEGDFRLLAFAHGAGRPFSAADTARPSAADDTAHPSVAVDAASVDSSHAAREQYLRRRSPCLSAFSPGSRPFFPCSLDFRSSLCFRLLQFFLRYRLRASALPIMFSHISVVVFSVSAPAPLRLRLVTFPVRFQFFQLPLLLPGPDARISFPVCFQLPLLLLPLRPLVPARLYLDQRLRFC